MINSRIVKTVEGAAAASAAAAAQIWNCRRSKHVHQSSVYV